MQFASLQIYRALLDVKPRSAGFGEDENGKYPKKLMMTSVTIVSNEQCRDAYQPEYGDLIKR